LKIYSDYTFNVSKTDSTADYSIDGQSDPSLYLLRSKTYTFEILAAQRHSSDIGRRVRAELKRIESQILTFLVTQYRLLRQESETKLRG